MFRYALPRHIRRRLNGFPLYHVPRRPVSYTEGDSREGDDFTPFQPFQNALQGYEQQGDEGPSEILESNRAITKIPNAFRTNTGHTRRRERLRKLYATKEPTVMVLNNVSEALTQEDFHLLLPKGKHIEGWRGQAGLLKG